MFGAHWHNDVIHMNLYHWLKLLCTKWEMHHADTNLQYCKKQLTTPNVVNYVSA
jgi:hypothetical protein